MTYDFMRKLEVGSVFTYAYTLPSRWIERQYRVVEEGAILIKETGYWNSVRGGSRDINDGLIRDMNSSEFGDGYCHVYEYVSL
jgi:hypothetical protein